MSHCILKSSIPAQRGIFTDIADIADSYWCWVRNKLTSAGTRHKSSEGWMISEFGTSNVTVFHAVDDDEQSYYDTCRKLKN